MRTQRITFLLAGLLFCWGSVLARYAIEIGSGGTLTAIADGNTGPYTFEWRDSGGVILNPTDNSVNELAGLNDGTYHLSIFNGYGCETILVATLGVISVDIKVFLEGAFDTNTNEMTTTLNTARQLLPGQTPVSSLASPTPAGQPYNVEPWNYNGTEGAGWSNANYNQDIVDWILVSIRTDTKKSSEVEVKAALLNKDGTVFFPEPFNNLSFIAEGYIVVEHRNHLSIISPTVIQVSDNLLSYDFTANDSYSSGGTGQKQLSNNKWVMFAGNCEQTGSRKDINGLDKIPWSIENGIFDLYINTDFNLDGDVNGNGKIFWERNNGIFGAVNFND